MVNEENNIEVESEVKAIKPPPLAGSFELSKDGKLWIAKNKKAKTEVENYIELYGDEAAKNISIK